MSDCASWYNDIINNNNIIMINIIQQRTIQYIHVYIQVDSACTCCSLHSPINSFFSYHQLISHGAGHEELHL